jgi:hypothetical protein
MIMCKKYTFFIIAISLLISIPTLAYTSTQVVENITRDTTWDVHGSPYLLNRNIQIYPGTTLIIKPGVEVVIDIGYSLLVGGELIARGEPENLVKFTSDNQTPQNVGATPGIVFLESAKSAKYKEGFVYDYDNHQILLEYDSGSILEYALIEYFPQGIRAYSLPAIMHSIIRYCGVGVNVFYSPAIPLQRRLFFYNNIVEFNKSGGLQYNATGGVPPRLQNPALICQNTFRYNGDSRWGAIQVDNSALMFNNVIFGNGIGVTGFYSSYNQSQWMHFLSHNLITHNIQGIRLGGHQVLLHNLLNENRSSLPINNLYGAGAYLSGPVGLLFNNTIQLNGVTSDGHGDGIAILSDRNSRFIIQNNNIGNSVWDMQDIYLKAGGDCTESSKMVVDATKNSWMTTNVSGHIYDQNDDMCLGVVNYEPVSTIAIRNSPMRTHPELISPADNEYLSGTDRITFSWEPVSGANKYIVVTYGTENIYDARRKSLNKAEITNNTSLEISFPHLFNYGMNSVDWFVIAGNDDGWTLPSEIRKVTYSLENILVSGRVIDINGNPIPVTYIYQPYLAEDGVNISYATFSDEDGYYSFMPNVPWKNHHFRIIFKTEKENYLPCLSFLRDNESYKTTGDLFLISDAQMDAYYDKGGIYFDSNNGTVAGVVVSSNGIMLSDTEVFLEPRSGTIFYLDEDNLPDLTLTKTGDSGKFVVLNVPPGTYHISGHRSGYSFEKKYYSQQQSIGPELSVVGGDIVTYDFLIGTSTSASGADGSAGNGGGGGCFILSSWSSFN